MSGEIFKKIDSTNQQGAVPCSFVCRGIAYTLY